MDRAWDSLFAGMDRWHQAKLFVEHSVTIEHDALHILFGVAIWLLLALIVRRPLTRWLPLLLLTAIIAFNEVVDFWVEIWPDPGQQLGESFKDLVLTIVVPFALMLAIRWRPRLFAR